MFQLGYLLPGFRFRARILPETYSSGGAKCNAAIIRVNGKRHLNQHILVFWSYVCHSISKYPFFLSQPKVPGPILTFPARPSSG